MGSMGGCFSKSSSVTLPDTAPAAVLSGPYGSPYTIQEVAIPEPLPKDALVQISYSGVCHGDVYSRDGGGPAPAQPVRPLVGGHEGVGTIVAMGTEGLDGFRVGDCVGVAWRSYVCESCQACKNGSENHCFNQKVTGTHRDGSFQRYISFPTTQLVRLPAGISLPSACPILCAGVTAYSSLRLMKPQPGKWCVIAGAAGGLGHLAIQYAKAMDLKVLAIDGGAPEKKDFCTRMGADSYVDFTKPDLVETVYKETDGGADYTLILSPHQSSYDAAGQYARFGGQIMAVGIGAAHMPLRPILKKDLLIRSNETGTKADMQAALELCASGKVTPELEMVGLQDINDALNMIKSGRVMGKVVMQLKGDT